MKNTTNAASRCATLILSLTRRQPYRAAVIFAVCASLCGVVTARDLARSKAKWLAYQAQLIADNPIPADLAPILPSDIPKTAGSLYGLANWPLDPPLPAGCWSDYEGAPLFWSASLNAVFADDAQILALRALAESLSPPPIPGGTNGLWTGDGGGGTVTPQIDLSTNTTDLYLQIAYLDTNTVRVTLTNTQNRLYELLSKTALSESNWVSEKVLEGVVPLTPTNITMGTRSNLILWARTYMPTNGQVFVTVPSSFTNFAPLVNGSVYSGQPVSEFPSQKLYVLNPTVTNLDLGFFDNDDYWPSSTADPNLINRPQQNAITVSGLPGCASLAYFTASRNPLTTLDLHGLTNLLDVEAYAAQLQSVSITGCSRLRRACFESNSISGTLDASGCVALQEFRAAANAPNGFTDVIIPPEAGPSLLHLCLRDNPQLNPSLVTNTLGATFTGMKELIMWNAGQQGRLNLVSTNLTWVWIYDNQLTEINFTNCTEMKSFWASGNRLTTSALDNILAAALQATNHLLYLNLTNNGFASPTGYTNFNTLKRILGDANCLMDIPPAWPVVLGGDWSLRQFNVSGSAHWLAFPTNNTAGNLLVCFSRDYVNDTTGVPMDSAGNTNWHSATTGTVTYNAGTDDNPITGHMAIWYCTNCLAGTNWVTLPFADGYSSSLWLMEFSGAATNGAVDVISTSDARTTNHVMSCGSLTTGTTNELVLAFAGYAVGVGGAGTNFTTIQDEAGGLGEYYRAASAGAVAPTETTASDSETYGMISVAFKHR